MWNMCSMIMCSAHELESEGMYLKKTSKTFYISWDSTWSMFESATTHSTHTSTGLCVLISKFLSDLAIVGDTRMEIKLNYKKYVPLKCVRHTFHKFYIKPCPYTLKFHWYLNHVTNSDTIMYTVLQGNNITELNVSLEVYQRHYSSNYRK